MITNEIPNGHQQVQQITIHDTYDKTTRHKISDTYNSTAKQEQEESDDTVKKQKQRIVKTDSDLFLTFQTWQTHPTMTQSRVGMWTT